MAHCWESGRCTLKIRLLRLACDSDILTMSHKIPFDPDQNLSCFFVIVPLLLSLLAIV